MIFLIAVGFSSSGEFHLPGSKINMEEVWIHLSEHHVGKLHSYQLSTPLLPSFPSALLAGGPFYDLIINSRMEKIDPGFTGCVNIMRQGANVPAL